MIQYLRTLTGDTYHKAFGAQIRSLRIDEQITPQVLASSIGIQVDYLEMVEDGKAPMDVAVARRCADFFGVDIGDIFERADKIKRAFPPSIAGDQPSILLLELPPIDQQTEIKSHDLGTLVVTFLNLSEKARQGVWRYLSSFGE